MSQFELPRYFDRSRMCDHAGMKHRHCFRPIHTTVYQLDAAGFAVPVIAFCHKHSPTSETELFPIQRTWR